MLRIMGNGYRRKPYRSGTYNRGNSYPRYRRRMRITDIVLLGCLGLFGLSWLGNWIGGNDSGTDALGLTSAADRNVYYRYCSDARAAGAAPLYRGDPGYRPALDADGDGTACEPYYGN